MTIPKVRRVHRPSAARRRHWENIYRKRTEDELSWHQSEPRLSSRLIKAYATPTSRILDAGGGSSSLAGRLSAEGFHRITVVDISGRALRRGRARTPVAARAVQRVRLDLLGRRRFGTFDLWHDRAVFHFLTRATDRSAYLRLVRRSLEPGGTLVVAAFAPDGPETCSGLPVARYTAKGLATEFGRDFRLVHSAREIHRTPWGTRQPFSYAVLQRRPTTPRPRREKVG